MLTESQIKNLKKGDKLLAEVQFNSFALYSDLICSAPLTANGRAVKANNYYHPSCLSLPPKHDPNRLFKKGDMVRYCERDERKLFRLQDGAIYEVKSNEGDAGTVEIWLWKEVGRYASYPYNVFELVTPVEEIEPYSIMVLSEDYHWVRIMKGTKIHSSIPFDEEGCVCRTLEEARAAAEEERDRLNAEYRKEQK